MIWGFLGSGDIFMKSPLTFIWILIGGGGHELDIHVLDSVKSLISFSNVIRAFLAYNTRWKNYQKHFSSQKTTIFHNIDQI